MSVHSTQRVVRLVIVVKVNRMAEEALRKQASGHGTLIAGWIVEHTPAEEALSALSSDERGSNACALLLRQLGVFGGQLRQ